jgi:hypothetical protein
VRAQRTVPDWAIGCMNRRYIVLGNAPPDPSIAIWIQTGRQYIDIRIPHDRPRFAGRRSLADLRAHELRQLAHQSGDTGVCTIRNRRARWLSDGASFGFFCDDVAIFPEDGRLDPRGRVIFETETSQSPVRYEEAWVQQPYDHGLVAHLSLRSRASPGRVLAVLLVTGRHAGFVERGTGDPERSLEARLAAAPDVARMRRILDCEASYAVRGRAGTPFRIRHSNLPFREGRVLDVPPLSPRRLARDGELPARRAGAFWRVESWFVQR